ncbi:MAG: response regulator [Polyangiaceae bacterium]|nr:response regulator [Polyangiaceae bacterium]
MRQGGKDLISVVVADDSDVAAAALERILEEDPRIRVMCRARNGAELLELPASRVAEVILLDLLMPELGGLSALRQLSSRTAVIVVSGERAHSALAREAIAQGAVGYVCKSELSLPGGAARLRDMVRTASHRERILDERVVLVAGSTGAVHPLVSLVRNLRDLHVPLLVVQHLPEGREEDLARMLGLTGVVARPAREGDSLAPGVLVAPFGWHMEIDRRERIHLSDAPPVNGHRPSADMLLTSAARLGRRIVAVMLSGLGNDGARGMALLAQQGAACFALHPDDCGATSMPLAALAASRAVQAIRGTELGARVRRVLSHGR